jgi:hypothetical protein
VKLGLDWLPCKRQLNSKTATQYDTKCTGCFLWV